MNDQNKNDQENQRAKDYSDNGQHKQMEQRNYQEDSVYENIDNKQEQQHTDLNDTQTADETVQDTGYQQNNSHTVQMAGPSKETEQQEVKSRPYVQENNQQGQQAFTSQNKQQNSNHVQQHTHNKTKSKGIVGGFLKLLAAGIVGSVMTLGVMTQTDYFQPEQDGQIPPQNAATETTAQPVSTEGSVADITENASQAIVGIVNMSEQPQNPFQQFGQQPGEEGKEVEKGVGSGVIYKVADDAAFIVTNNHVVEGSSSLQVALPDGDKVDGEIVGADPLTDMAIVKIKGDFDITPLKFGDSDALRSGDEVIAIGNPLGLDFSRTVTKGIVSAKDRTIPVQTSAGQWEFDVIQTDAAINPGNSGGALINMQGELVGINSLKIANSQVEGLGFAIPSNKVQDLIEELAKNGKVERPYIGVGLRSVSDIPRYYLHDLPDDVKDGAVVLTVDEDSAAADAGIQVEDVIVAIDGENVTNDNDVRGYLYKETKIGDTVKLELYRDGEVKTVELTLTSNENVE